MSKLPSLATAMTPFPYSVDVAAPVDRARELMHQHSVRHLPVTADGKTVGVIAEHDILLLRRIIAANDTGAEAADSVAALVVPVGSICSEQVYLVDIHTPLAEVALEMGQRKIGAAVVQRKGKLAGILTMTDVARVLAEVLLQLAGETPPPRSA